MNSFKKIFALLLALLCLCSFAACTGNEGANSGDESNSLALEDGEDAGLEKKKVVVANVTGKDAVSMLVRPSCTQECSDNDLSQDYFHSNKALELSYVEKAENIYDIRLVFEDGSYEDFTDLDYSKTIGYIYLGNEEPSAEETTE
ncbi:MAG: hypothetical protein IJN38_06865 [Clostridia bacterium]|nr:hypothetical protein [Clostridia bacterium]